VATKGILRVAAAGQEEIAQHGIDIPTLGTTRDSVVRAMLSVNNSVLHASADASRYPAYARRERLTGRLRCTEGYLSMPVEPWQIPFRALLPRQHDASNLLVPVCISASTVAYGSFRMEPNYMIAGQSAGVAAALAIKSKRPIHLIDIAALQKQLRDEHQILSLSDVRSAPSPNGAPQRNP
jgi:hypothetical protein